MMLGVQYESINCEEGVPNYRTVFIVKTSSKCLICHLGAWKLLIL